MSPGRLLPDSAADERPLAAGTTASSGFQKRSRSGDQTLPQGVDNALSRQSTSYTAATATQETRVYMGFPC